MSLLSDPTEFLLRMVSKCSGTELIKVPVLSCPLAAGLHSLLESPRPQLWCTGPAAPAHCAGWSHTHWTLAGSHRAVASVQCTPPASGQRREKNRHSVSIFWMCKQRTKHRILNEYLHPGWLFGKNKRHKDYGEFLWVINHEYKAEAEHADGYCMLRCSAVFLTTMGKLKLLLDSGLLAKEGRGSWRHVIGGLLGRFVQKMGRGWMEAVDSLLTLSSGGRDQFRCGTGALHAPDSERDNGSWALTSDCLPPLPVPSNPALGWQEELELYCHPGKNLSSNQEPPFRCMDEAVSLFSSGGLMALSSNRAEYRSNRRDSTGQDNLCHCDQIWPDTPFTLVL